MIKAIVPYILLFCFLWFLPDMYIFSKNASNYLYKEARFDDYARVEIKVAKKLPFLPEKYSVLGMGEKNVRVVLMDVSKEFVVSALVNEQGVAIIDSVPHSKYKLLIGPEVTDYTPDEIIMIEKAGQSVLEEDSLIETSIDNITISSDVYIAPVIKK